MKNQQQIKSNENEWTNEHRTSKENGQVRQTEKWIDAISIVCVENNRLIFSLSIAVSDYIVHYFCCVFFDFCSGFYISCVGFVSFLICWLSPLVHFSRAVRCAFDLCKCVCVYRERPCLEIQPKNCNKKKLLSALHQKNHVEFDNFQLPALYTGPKPIHTHTQKFLPCISHFFSVRPCNFKSAFDFCLVSPITAYLIFADVHFSSSKNPTSVRANTPSSYLNRQPKRKKALISALDGFMLLMILLLASKSNLLLCAKYMDLHGQGEQTNLMMCTKEFRRPFSPPPPPSSLIFERKKIFSFLHISLFALNFFLWKWRA